jgi:hypothetical protein
MQDGDGPERMPAVYAGTNPSSTLRLNEGRGSIASKWSAWDILSHEDTPDFVRTPLRLVQLDGRGGESGERPRVFILLVHAVT